VHPPKQSGNNTVLTFHVLTCWCALQEFQAVDHVAEQAYRVTQEDRDDDAHHEAGVRQVTLCMRVEHTGSSACCYHMHTVCSGAVCCPQL